MSLPVLIAFAGVLVAAVATGMLAGRCVRQPRIGFIVWTAATVALTVALAAQSTGFASGFGPATFRAVQLFGLMLAPLWIAWGLAELVWPGEAARFGARLVCGALTVVGAVILATDPLTGQPFGRSWPLAGVHYQVVSHDVLDLAQAVAVVIAAVSAGLAASRASNDRQRAGALAGVGLAAAAVLMTVGLRVALPARSLYPLLDMVAAALVWAGAAVMPDVPGGTGRDRGVSEPGDHRAPSARYAANGRYAARGPGGPRRPPGAAQDRYPGPDRYPGQDRYPPPDRYTSPDPYPGPDTYPGPDPYPPQDRYPGPDRYRGGAAPAGAAPGGSAQAAHGTRPAQRPGAAAAQPRPYGRILIFTLLEDRAADFDRLAEQTAEQVRTAEPDTVVYVIHLVPNAPLQRIFYEIYRDRAAFDRHENQPYMQRFAAERRSHVLATNVIELRLKYAKVAPLPDPKPLPPSPPGPGRLPSAARRTGGI